MLLILDQSPSLPVITGFSPASGPVTTVIRVALQSGGVGITAAAVGGTAADFVVESDTVVRVTVPGGATSGLISLTNAAGSALSTTEFTVSAAPLDLSGATDGQLLQRVSGAIAGVNVGSGLEIVSGALRWIVQRLDQFLPPTNPVDFGGQKAVGLGTPTASTDAATKNYVDTLERVTSVGLSVPAILDVTGSPITAAGTIALSLISQAANRFFAGPTSGGDATPAFRALVPDDFGTGSVGGFLRKDAGGVMSWATPAGGGGQADGSGPYVQRFVQGGGITYLPIGINTSANASGSVGTAQAQIFLPFVMPKTLPISNLGVNNLGGTPGTATIRLGIFSNQQVSDSEAGSPFLLRSSPLISIVDTGTIALSSIPTGTVNVNCPTSATLQAGELYWLHFWRSGGSTQFLSSAAANFRVLAFTSGGIPISALAWTGRAAPTVDFSSSLPSLTNHTAVVPHVYFTNLYP